MMIDAKYQVTIDGVALPRVFTIKVSADEHPYTIGELCLEDMAERFGVRVIAPADVAEKLAPLGGVSDEAE